MTLEQFYKAVEKLPPTFRRQRREVVIRFVRFFRGKPLEKQAFFCPITAVAFHKKKEFYTTTMYRDAARAIGLSSVDVDAIIPASDLERPSPIRTALLRAARKNRKKTVRFE